MADESDAPFALVVDDDGIIRMNACDILSDAGFRPLEAENADEALSVLEQHAGDITLLFTDVQMPGARDGFDLARETAKRWPDIKILVASGAAKPGPDDLPPNALFVGKPFSAQVVEARLHERYRKAKSPNR